MAAIRFIALEASGQRLELYYAWTMKNEHFCILNFLHRGKYHRGRVSK